MFSLFFNKQKVIQQAQGDIYQKWHQEREERALSSKRAREFELEEHLGKLVICLSNEIENLTVGYGKEIQYITQAQDPVLIVHDIVRNEDVMILGIVFNYTEQKFHALNRLDANERISLFYGRLADEHIDKTSTKVEDPMPYEQWNEKVQEAIKKFQAQASVNKNLFKSV